ncbi:heptaprenyl diphosphate synthase component 1 [Paenibacillus koleovorans]|uniref:heptaprenyl diphosphate synthase component 1 n=1 Tax=Paenibacillus koleovorans TaxID=121608 RepID=UPI000FDB6BF6|nr:heptaprenyl diphosphate synthase component 1 [Paenibacillus koleovorans]
MEKHSIEDTATKYTQYDMIQSNTELPAFPNLRTELLYMALHKGSSAELSELYALVASLAQLGLDTHDLIPATNERKEKKEARARQLKVLAGDYFSSRFYHLLSQAGQVEMIRQMSGAICEVNRLKMGLYTKMRQWKVTADEYLQQTVHIKSQLYTSFAKQMEGSLLKLWPELLTGFTRCEIILDEIKRLDTVGGFRAGWAFWHIMQSGTKEEKRQLQLQEDPDQAKLRTLLLKYNVKAQLFHMLESQFKLVSDKVRQLDSDKLVQDVYRIGEPFTRYLAAPRALEEG